MVFGNRFSPYRWILNGYALVQTKSFQYLGLTVHHTVLEHSLAISQIAEVSKLAILCFIHRKVSIFPKL